MRGFAGPCLTTRPPRRIHEPGIAGRPPVYAMGPFGLIRTHRESGSRFPHTTSCSAERDAQEQGSGLASDHADRSASSGPVAMSDRRDVLLHPRRAMTFGSSFLLVAIALGVAVSIHPGPSTADHWWAGVVADGRTPFFTFLAERVFDTLGRFPFSWCIVGAAALILHHARRSSSMWVLLAGEVASWATNNAIKSIVDRPRPPGALLHASGSSYPSGHAAFAAVTAVLLVALLPTPGRRAPWAGLGLVLAVGMAWSRTYLMVHWLTDVLGGLCVGAGVGLVTLAAWSLGGHEAIRPASRADLGSPTP